MSAEIRQAFSACAFLLAVAFQPEAAADQEKRRLPRQLIDSSPREHSELSWRNGERLKGDPAGADENHLNWKTALFNEEMSVRRDAASRVDFAGKTIAPKETFRFVLADGSHLTGSLKSIEYQTISLSSVSCGDVAVSRDQLVAIERINGPRILAAGPASLLSGKSTAKGRYNKKPPFLSAGGNVVFLEFNGGVHHPVDLPEKCLVSLRLRIEHEPAFSLVIASETKWVSLETWSDELVLAQDDRFVSAGVASTDADGLFDIQLGFDRVAGTCVLFDQDGNSTAELEFGKANDASPLPSFAALGPFLGPVLDHVFSDPDTLSRARLGGRSKGIALTNRGAGFVVERYLVAEWSGSPPPVITEASTYVETDDEPIAGEPVACDGTSVTVRSSEGSERQVPLNAVRSMRWPRPVKMESDPALTHLWYSNGNLVRGTMLKIVDGSAHMNTAFTSMPVLASLEHCRALLLPVPDPAEDTVQPLDELDVIAAGDLALRGTIHPSGDDLPRFLPTGCDASLVPAARENLVITRHLPLLGDYERAPALLHTKSKETLPVMVENLDADKIEFQWSAVKGSEVTTPTLHAVQFSAPAANVDQGFGGEGWQILGRRGVLPERTKNGIVLHPDTGIGHPYLLHGEDLSFSFVKGEQLASMRVRLFCQGTDRNSDSMNFLVAHYGNRIYSGLEHRQEGQMESSKSFEVESETAPVQVEFKFIGDTVELQINGDAMVRSSIKEKTGRKTGAGLILETASVFGNRFGPVTLSDFSMRGSPSLVGAPPFSDDAKRESLLLPRLRRDVPPRHILIGRNGDLLRGEIGGTSDTSVLFRVGLESFNVPMDRIAAAVWVQKADKTMESNVKKKPAPTVVASDKDTDGLEPDPFAGPELVPAQPTTPGKAEPGKILESHAEQWLTLTNGGRFRLEVESWNPDSVVGNHPILARKSHREKTLGVANS
jgi:hypothetical protein